MTSKRILRLKEQLQQARLRLNNRDDQLGKEIQKIIFVASDEVERISTNGHCIYFNPDWLQKLGEKELDFILAHELLHIRLGHIDRPKYFIGDRYHLACDVIVNSLLEAYGWKDEWLAGIGNIYATTFFPRIRGDELSPEEAFECIPFDPSALKEGKRRRYMIDSEQGWDMKEDRGESGTIILRPEEENPPLKVVEEEENKVRLIKKWAIAPKILPEGEGEEILLPEAPGATIQVPDPNPDRLMQNEVNQLRQIRDSDSALTDFPSTERMWRKSNAAAINWRTLLSSFIQQEVFDYSFTPPDRRLQDSDLFLPDFNVAAERVKDVLFMVDTSASIGDEALSTAFGEIDSAFSFLDGGLVGFFDSRVRSVFAVKNAEELEGIAPLGNGATDFGCIFEHIKNKMTTPPTCVVVFTDGAAKFPPPDVAGEIPVMWLLTDRSVFPPWGTVAYMK